MTKEKIKALLAECRLREQDHRATASPKNISKLLPKWARKTTRDIYTREAEFFKSVGDVLAIALKK